MYNSFYIRGRLRRGKDGDPMLVMGESVQYCSITGRCSEPELLMYSKRAQQHLKATSKKDKVEYKRLAQQAEKYYADQVKDKLGNRRVHSSVSLRPLQPVRLEDGTEGVVILPKDDLGFVHVKIADKVEKKPVDQIRLVGKPDKLDLDEFFRQNRDDLPKQKVSCRKDSDYLLSAWRKANKDHYKGFERCFRKMVETRAHIREMASRVDPGNVSPLKKEAMARLKTRSATLLRRLQEDFNLPREESMMTHEDFRARIKQVKDIIPSPNMLLLCGGIAPEVTAYKRLGAAPLGVVIVQDTDLHAVGVAVASHPDVHFAIVIDPEGAKKPGDVKILRKTGIIREIEVGIGGIHSVGITNPCQSFSKAGKKDGFHTAEGLLLIDCATVVRSIGKSSEMPMFLAENVPSTLELDKESDEYLPETDYKYFRACASMCTPCFRDRKFATNRPPVDCVCSNPRLSGKEPPSLDGDLEEAAASSVICKRTDRMIHPELKKFPCLTHSGPKSSCIWQRQGDYKTPERSTLTAEEAERAMGYKSNEIGVTAISAERAVRERIQKHNVATDGPLVSLKGCAYRRDLLTKVSESRRLALLGNSQAVTLLEALLWNERNLFPAGQG
eukprot:scaffold41083_cov191-Amphora_coffeaeformis.AAC.1